jgi:hypothetical protein
LRLKNLVEAMKLKVVENFILQKSKLHLRVFKGIAIGINLVSEMSEKLLIPEKELKRILNDLEQVQLIVRVEGN